MENKIFAGRGNVIETKYGVLPTIALNKDDVRAIMDYMELNKSEWCNLTLKKKKDVAEGSKFTHYLEINQQLKKTHGSSYVKADKSSPQEIRAEGEHDDLPF